VFAIQMQPHVVLALRKVVAQPTAKTRRFFVCVNQNHVWRKDKFEKMLQHFIVSIVKIHILTLMTTAKFVSTES